MNATALCMLPFSLLAPLAAAQWSTPTLVNNVSWSGLDFDPSPTIDGMTLYLSSNRTGNYEIFRATRTVPYGSFGVPVQLTELGSTGTEAAPCPRIDDLEIFFYSTRAGGGGGGLDIWRADRTSRSAPFNPPVPVPELNSSAAEGGPCLTLAGLQIYFFSSRTGGMGGFDIYTATRPNWFSPFGPPTPVTELNTTTDDMEPHVSHDGLTIFFSSGRAGGLGLRDTWMATRLDTTSPFGNIVNVTALNSSAYDEAPGFALFDDEIFFTSQRPGGPGSYDIYSARFTGVTGSGIAGVASARDLRFSDPASPGKVYVAAASGGSTPGIPIDTRVLPLNFDLLLQLTIGGLPPLMTGYVGVLDQDGIGSGKISFAGFPGFAGLRFFNAFVVIDPTAPSGIKTISNAHEVQVQ